MTGSLDDEQLTRRCVTAVHHSFAEYERDFADVTRRAPSRFASQDWKGVRRDILERLDLYAEAVTRVVGVIRRTLGGRIEDKTVWAAMKRGYTAAISTVADVELAETFFNSVTRRVFTTVGVDPAIEFVDVEFERQSRPVPSLVRVHHTRGDLGHLVRETLDATSFGERFHDVSATAALIAGEIEQARRRRWGDQPVERIEVVDASLYRGFGVYMIGRVVGGTYSLPLAVSFLCDERGVTADAVLLTEHELSIVFSFTRSYFLVDVERIRDVVDFLAALIPLKPRSELYIALGYNKHGKSEFYRDLLRHLDNSTDRFEVAPGDPGMVMTVFTLPSFDVVFKIIRDRFAYPKTTVREDVMGRYRLVFRHDRAGRLIDAQEFEFLEFDRDRFSPDLLEELLESASETVRLEGGRVVINHLYIERRVTPLNLFLSREDDAACRAAILDYGQAVRDLAASNIFPGDLLLKNFGVTRHGRVIFYDYDELCLVTDCKFRDMPQARDDEDEMRSEAWFYVGPNDIFPEEFANFVGIGSELMAVLRAAHGEIFEASYWREVQQMRRNGIDTRIFAYPHEKRLRGRGASLPR